MDKRTIDALQYLYDNSRFHKVKIVNLLSFFKTYQEEYDFLLANDYLIRERKYIRIADKGLTYVKPTPIPKYFHIKWNLEGMDIINVILAVASIAIGLLQIS